KIGHALTPRWDWAISHLSTLPIRLYERPINRKPFHSRRGEVATRGNPPSGESRRSIHRIGTGRAEDLTGSHVRAETSPLCKSSCREVVYGKEISHATPDLFGSSRSLSCHSRSSINGSTYRF